MLGNTDRKFLEAVPKCKHALSNSINPTNQTPHLVTEARRLGARWSKYSMT